MHIQKLIFGIAMICLNTLSVSAQDNEAVTQWKYSISKQVTKPGEIIELVFTVAIDKGWHLYSSDFKADIGPLPTEFAFVKNDTYDLIGNVQPVNPIKKRDKTWDTDYTYFQEKAVFKQKIKVLKPAYKIAGTIKGLTCSELDGLCVPFTKDFQF